VAAVGGDEDGLPPAVGVRCVEDLGVRQRTERHEC
jgi:hypothetical protein